jgi:uncharacterized membrane protein
MTRVIWMTIISFFILFSSSIVRHELFNSNAWDLGIFDQGIYLISQGLPPISSLLGFHILADHAAWILYAIALLYKIYPSVYWLFFVQSVALSLGALPAWYLSRQAGLKANLATTIAAVYLLYPLVYNANLFDFHPEVIAVPALLTAVLTARLGKTGWFCLSILLVLGCKAVLSLTVAAMGVWLIFFDNKRRCGVIALISGIAWFIIANQAIIPLFANEAAQLERHLYRYSYLGNSFSQALQNVWQQPGFILGKIFSTTNLEYLLLLLSPVIWGILPKGASFRGISPLVGAIPCILLNILADHQSQKHLVFHYSLPALPFLMVAVISSLATDRAWIKNQKVIIVWSLVGFFALAKYGFFGSVYLKNLDTWKASREAISLIKSQVKSEKSVFTTLNIVPHLTHRKIINFPDGSQPPQDLNQFDYILLNPNHPKEVGELTRVLINQSQKNPKCNLIYEHNDVYLFEKSG